jgi:hypothetical protein
VTVACASAAACALLAYYLIAWLQVSPTRERGTDFSASYVAAQVLRDGHGAQLYDQQFEHQRHLALLPPGTTVNLPFITPPTTAILALPFTGLDPGAAFRLWSLLQLALLAGAIAIAIRAGPWPARAPSEARWTAWLLGMAGLPTFAFMLLGQIDGLTALGLAGGYASLRRGHHGRAGLWIALGFAATKPHLALGLGAWLLARRDLRSLTGAAIGVAAAAAVSLAAVGFDGVGGFLGALGFAYGNTPAASTVGLPGLVASWFGGGGSATALGVAAALAAIAGCAALGSRSRKDPSRLEVSLAGAVALSLVASPHLLTHDLVILAPAFAWCLARATAFEAPERWPGRLSRWLLTGWIGFNALAVIDTGNSAPAPPGRLVPWGLLVAGVLAWRAQASSGHLTATRVVHSVSS